MASQIASAETAQADSALRSDSWLSDVCGRAVFRVAQDAQALADDGGAAVAAELKAQQPEFAFAKLNTTCVEAVGSLAKLGFLTVDVNLTLARKSDQQTESLSAPADVTVNAVDCGQSCDPAASGLPQIAGECFRFSRFHLDPQFPNELADRIKYEWIANYLRGARGDRIWEARVEGRPAGFLAAITNPKSDAAIIDLIGVSPQFQGRGVGKALIRAFLTHYASRSSQCLVGTQAANTPSLRLYQKLGFQFDSSAFVLHWHST